MIDLLADRPTLYWTYDSIELHRESGGGDETWIADQINPPVVRPNSIRFDAPENWESSYQILSFAPCEDGYWRFTSGTARWEAMRVETPTHNGLVGTWLEADCRGAFIALFPKAP